MWGQLSYTVGMFLMAVCRTKAAVLIFPATAGVMYATQFTLPYILVVHYHNTNMVSGILEQEEGYQLVHLSPAVSLLNHNVIMCFSGTTMHSHDTVVLAVF